MNVNMQNSFGGFNLDDVLKNEEAKKKSQEPQKPAPVQMPQQHIATTTYEDVEFEQPAVDWGKSLVYFNHSLERLRKAGFERHARPQEAVGLTIAHLEGKLPFPLRIISKEMRESYGEWLSAAFERQGDRLILYLDPEGLVGQSAKYIKNNFTFTDKQEFNIAGKPSNQLINLTELDDALVKALYGRAFKDLPHELSTGTRDVSITLPPDGVVYPIGREDQRMYHLISYNFYWRASRGVRVKK